jgi:short-subunit dehydrogenase
MGAVFAHRLAREGYNLLLVARNQERLEAVAESVNAKTGRTVDILPADLTKSDELAKVETVLKNDPGVTMLVNNAGFGGVASVLNADVDQMENMIDLNVTALTRLCYAAAPAFAARDEGTIVNISSVVGIAAEILNGVYAASKAYVLAFGHALNNDLKDTNVRVQTVLPGATATEFWDVAGYAAQKESAITMSAENAVDAALAGLEAGELVTIPGLQDSADWDNWEAARRALSPKLANAQPGPRYGLQQAAE